MDLKLTRAEIPSGAHLKFYLVGIKYSDIVEQLGRPFPSSEPEKTRVEFRAVHDDGRRIAVWDWKASHIPLTDLDTWSGWGDIDLAHELFGFEKVKA